MTRKYISLNTKEEEKAFIESRLAKEKERAIRQLDRRIKETKEDIERQLSEMDQ